MEGIAHHFLSSPKAYKPSEMEHQDISSHLLGSSSQIFMGAIIEVYRDDNKLFGFTCYREVGQLRVFNARPIYTSSKDAWQEAKKYCFLLTISTDITSNAIACDFSSDKVVAQTKPTIKLLGEIEGLQSKDLFVQDWGRICQQTKQTRCHQEAVVLCGIDGQQIKSDISFEFVEIDAQSFIVARWGAVHHFP